MIKFNIQGDIDNLDVKIQKTVKRVVKCVTALEHVKGKHYVSFIFVNDEYIQDINRRYRNIDRATDVISFAAIDDEPNRELPVELGDIFISIDHVKAQALEYGHSELRELAFLVTHGLLHILGYDHMKPSDEEVMFGIQDHVLEKLKIER